MQITPMFASDFGSIAIAEFFAHMFVVASAFAVVALLLAAFRKTRGFSIWISSLSVVAGLLIFGFYLLGLSKQADWILLPLSMLPLVMSGVALFWGVRSVKNQHKDAG